MVASSQSRRIKDSGTGRDWCCNSVFNDNGYGVLRNVQNGMLDGRHIGVDLHGLNMEKVYGIWYSFLLSHNTRDVPARTYCALRNDQLSLIEVDMDEIGPYRIPFAGYALSN